ncbi:peptidase M23 [Streptomyces sp. NPDC045456]|uniref:peptidase M23 n=1 Tax=Streptomyces sp. NPDC045456 TaxID=3155254 RepID=UPI0033EC6FBE
MEGRDILGALAKAAGRGVALKAAAIAAVVFLVFLLLVGLFGAAGTGGQAYASSCGDRGTPNVDVDDGNSGGDQNPGGDVRAKQIANAKVIDSVAKEHGLTGRATLVALMTGLQESTLLNLNYGDRDSLGVFQQRANWGSAADRTDVRKSAAMFFFGGKDGSRGLTDIKGWENKALGDAAQAVQISAFPDLYAGQESGARKIASQAGIDLNRGGKTGNEGQADGGEAGSGSVGTCHPDSGDADKPGKPGQAFYDGNAPWPQNVKNPRSTADAIKWAKGQAENGSAEWYRACLAFVAQVYGWGYSGVPYAQDHYHQMPAAMKHDKARNPPPGALMYWDTGQRAGHVAVYLGGGKIASNDILRPGYIDVVDATDIERKWGATYLGWAPPYFPKGG